MSRYFKLFVAINVFALILIVTTFAWILFAQQEPLSAMAATFRPNFYSGQFETETRPFKSLYQGDVESIPPSEYRFLKGTNRSLIIAITGFTGNAQDPINDLMAAPGVRAGWNFISLPNPSDWKFALHRLEAKPSFKSTTQALCAAAREAIADSETEASEIRLAGTSLGARFAVAMANEPDCFEGKIGVTGVLAINPPLDLRFAAEKLDFWVLRDRSRTLPSYIAGFRILLLKTLSYWEFGPSVDRNQSADQAGNRRALDFWIAPLRSSGRALETLIARQFAIRLERMTLKRDTTGYESPSEDFKFANVIPSLDEQGTDQFIATVAHLRNRKQRVSILHSRDDFLNRPADIETLASLGETDTVVLPDGGHTGAIFQENGAAIIDRFFN